jgi:hypothetical protein
VKANGNSIRDGVRVIEGNSLHMYSVCVVGLLRILLSSPNVVSIDASSHGSVRSPRL